MKRFILLMVLGAAGLMLGEAVIGAGLHPDYTALPGSSLLQGCLALMIGSALFVSGLLGLAEVYEKVVVAFAQLLAVKQLPSSDDLSVRSAAQLQDQNRRFWKAYQKSALGICIFMAGILALTVGLSRFSLTLYLAGVGGGVILLGIVAVAMAYRGTCGMRGCCTAVQEAVACLAAQPDFRPEIPEPFEKKAIPRYTLFSRPSRPSRYSRSIRR